MPPRVKKTGAASAGPPGPLRRSPRLAEKKRRREEDARRRAEAAEAAETAQTARATQAATAPLPTAGQPSKAAPYGHPAAPGAVLVPCLDANTRPSADYLQSLLPGGLFFGYAAVADDDGNDGDDDDDAGDPRRRPVVWSVRRERALLRAHWDADRRRLQQQHRRLADPHGPAGPYGPRLVDTELGLWAVLQHRFRCGLDDLFRYGLRPDAGPAAAAGAASAEAAAAAAATRYCRKLTTLLAHPLWTPADLAAVRWLLQRTIQARVSEQLRASGDGDEDDDSDIDHPAPIVPPYAYSRPPFVDTARQWASAAADRRRRGVADADETASAAAAAAEAEAELTWFLFSANAPRDLWLLDWLLDNPEAGAVPGGRLSTTVAAGEEEGDSSDNDSDDSDDSGDSNIDARRRRVLRVRTTICTGGLGSVDSHAYAASEVALRFTRRQQADRHAQATTVATAAATGPPPDTRPDNRVLFLLQERDLDHLLGLLASPDFLEHTGFAAPARYSAGYAHAHATYGRGPGGGGGPAAAAHPPPAAAQPICNVCLLAFHDDDDDDDDDDNDDDSSAGPGPLDDDDGGGGGDDDGNNNTALDAPDHVHYFHQFQVRDIPPQHAVAWLLQRKGAWLLAARREEAIWRERQQQQGVGGSDVPDIPPFDPSPLAHLDHVFSDASQLAALKGCRRIGRAHAAERWCFGFGGGSTN